MAEAVVDMDFDTKYGHLTKPLKEAAACWDIDLEEVMDSFLAAQNDDVASMDPAHMLNFAQAGMLVSSTATNYGRKVEHLYTLVYSTLDTMSKGEGKSLASSALMKRMRKRIVGFQEFENGFELLDPQFQQPAKGIDLSPEESLSNGSHITRRVPLLLLPREDSGEKSAKDSTGNSGPKQSANGTEYKTSSCWVSDSGCLLLDPGFSVYEERIVRGRDSLSGPLVPGLPSTIPEDLALPDLAMPEEPGDIFPDDISPSSPFLGETEDIPKPSPEDPVSPPAFPPLPPAQTKRDRASITRVLEPSIPPKPTIDPFAILDPYSVPANTRNVKPKFGRCHQTPPELKSIFDLTLSSKSAAFSRQDLFSADSAGKPKEETPGLAGVPGLEPLRNLITLKVREEKRKAAQAARELRRKNSLDGLLDSSDDEEHSLHHSARHSVSSARHSVASFGHHEEEDSRPLQSTVGQSLVLKPSREDRMLHAERQRIAGLEQVLEGTKLMYDELMKRKLAELITGQDWEEEQPAGQMTQSVASIVAAAGNSVQDRIPELYANIRKWQDNLEPLLEEQSARPLFDLDDYLVSIIDKLKTSGTEEEEDQSAISDFLKSVGAADVMEDGSPNAKKAGGPISSFEDLVKGEPKWNVCRLFLSTLILTNNGNVEIFNDNANETAVEADVTPRSATPARVARTPAAQITPNALAVAGTPLRGSHTFGASQSFQVKLRNADKNLKFAIQDNAAVVSGVIPIMTNKDVPAPEPIGDVPFADDE